MRELQAPKAAPEADPEIRDNAGEVLHNVLPSADLAQAEEVFWFWLGLLPPISDTATQIETRGIEFPARTEVVWLDRLRETRREEYAGHVRLLSRADLRRLQDGLAHTVLRPTGRDSAASFLDLDGGHRRAPIYAKLRIAREDELTEAKKAGRAVRPYIARQDDLPLASCVYAVWLDEVSPRPRGRGAELPEPVSVTGLVVPPPGARAVPPGERLTVPRDEVPRTTTKKK